MDGSFAWPNRLTIAIRTPAAHDGARALASALASRGFTASLRTGSSGDIVFSPGIFANAARVREGYRITVGRSGARIEAGSSAGFFYGAQTLEQLAPLRLTVIRTPALVIEDWPAFAWRGIHLDVSRHFFAPSVVKRYIDIAAHYKLNVFHWHLTDSNAWRLPIPDYPRLTQAHAAYRLKDVRDIIAFAAQRGVTVIPEIDIPSHSAAAIAAYPELACGRGGDALCPSKATFAFVDAVFRSVAALFPGSYIHAGGDESGQDATFFPHVQRLLRANGKRLVGWDEVVASGVSSDAVILSWRGEAPALRAAESGHDVVFSPDGPLYFDAIQGDRTQEPRGTPYLSTLEEVYDYSPDTENLMAAARAHVLGVQANLWTTYVPTQSLLFYQLLPRELALAETAWTPRTRKRWSGFLARLPQQFAYLQARGYPFRIPNTAFVIDAPSTRFVAVKGQVARADAVTAAKSIRVRIETLVPLATIHFTTDGSWPTQRSPVFVRDFVVARNAFPVTLRAIAILPDGRRSGVSTCVVHPVTTQALRGYVRTSTHWSSLVSP